MALYASLLLLPAILSGPFVARVNAAPTTYDQTQTGDFNVDAKFENFLVLVATSGSSSLFNNLAAQALELNELIGERSKAREKSSETMVYETEDADGGREPYHVEIVRIEKEGDGKHPDKSSDAKNEEGIELGTSLKSADNSEKNSQQTSDLEVSIDSRRAEKKTRSLWAGEETRVYADGSLEESKRAVESKNLQMENLDHPDDLAVKEEALRATKPGISLKKQLSRKEEEAASSSISQERNELDNKYQELVLIGGGIENCGPGRYRDKLGVCQRDKDFN